jgi:nucleotide-binding universal stress UspA family protein
MTDPRAAIPVVVAYDFSPMSEEALHRAVEAASRVSEYVLHVITALDSRDGIAIAPTRQVDAGYVERIRRLVSKRVADMLVGLACRHEIRFSVHVQVGPPAPEILGLARRIGASLLFIGSHAKSDLQRIVLGSVSECVLRDARCPVMVSRRTNPV